MAIRKKALLLVNKGSRNGGQDIAEGVDFLKSRGIDVLMHHPDDGRDLAAQIDKHHRDIDFLIIGGGDGTLNCAARSILERRIPFGILPLGTANDLARTLNIPADLPGALNVIVNGRLLDIDLGSVNGVLFFNAANIGLGTKVTRQLSREIKGRLGVLSYAHSTWKAIKANYPFRARIVCDGRVVHTRSIQIAVGNGRFYGGGMVIDNDATISDQRLDLYSLKPQKFWKLLSLTPALRAGQFSGQQEVEVLHGKEIEIFTRRRKSVSTDGELTTRTPAKFQVIPNAARVFVP